MRSYCVFNFPIFIDSTHIPFSCSVQNLDSEIELMGEGDGEMVSHSLEWRAEDQHKPGSSLTNHPKVDSALHRNRKLLISIAPTKAKSQEPAYSQVLNQNKIDRQRSRSRESGRQTVRRLWWMVLGVETGMEVWGWRWIRIGFAKEQCFQFGVKELLSDRKMWSFGEFVGWVR